MVCILCMQASQALALTVSRVHLMEDVNVHFSPPEALVAALDDVSQGEVFDSLNFWRFSFVCQCFIRLLVCLVFVLSSYVVLLFPFRLMLRLYPTA
jgi:hypothetical protein